MKKILIGCGVLFAVLVVALFAFLVYVGTSTPETMVVRFDDVSAHTLQQVDELDLLQEGESIRFLYSDGFLHVRDGCYLLTDRALVIYVEAWGEPATRIPVEAVQQIELMHSESFFLDSLARVSYVELDGEEMWITFPLSGENGGDREFLIALGEPNGLPVEDFVDEPLEGLLEED